MAWMTQEEAALALGVSPQTIRRRVGNGSLRATRHGQAILVDVELSESWPARLAEGPAPSPEQVVETAVHQAAIRPVASEADFARGYACRAPGPNVSAASVPAEASGGRWMGVIAWLTTTGLLFAVAVAAWIHHQADLRYRDLEERYRQANLDHQQAASAQEARLQALRADADRRQESMTSDLAGAQARIDSSKRKLEAQGATISELRASLGTVKDDLARTIARRDKLTVELASARTSLAAAKVRQHLGVAIEAVSRELRAVGSRIVTLARPASSAMEADTEPGTQYRAARLPDPAPVRPAVAVQLRSIVEPPRLPEAEASARQGQTLSSERSYETP